MGRAEEAASSPPTFSTVADYATSRVVCQEKVLVLFWRREPADLALDVAADLRAFLPRAFSGTSPASPPAAWSRWSRGVDLADERRGRDGEGIADDAGEPFVVLVFERRLAVLDQLEVGGHELQHPPAQRIAAHLCVEIVLESPNLVAGAFLGHGGEGVGRRAGYVACEALRGRRNAAERAHWRVTGWLAGIEDADGRRGNSRRGVDQTRLKFLRQKVRGVSSESFWEKL